MTLGIGRQEAAEEERINERKRKEGMGEGPATASLHHRLRRLAAAIITVAVIVVAVVVAAAVVTISAGAINAAPTPALLPLLPSLLSLSFCFSVSCIFFSGV